MKVYEGDMTCVRVRFDYWEKKKGFYFWKKGFSYHFLHCCGWVVAIVLARLAHGCISLLMLSLLGKGCLDKSWPTWGHTVFFSREGDTLVLFRLYPQSSAHQVLWFCFVQLFVQQWSSSWFFLIVSRSYLHWAVKEEGNVSDTILWYGPDSMATIPRQRMI